MYEVNLYIDKELIFQTRTKHAKDAYKKFAGHHRETEFPDKTQRLVELVHPDGRVLARFLMEPS